MSASNTICHWVQAQSAATRPCFVKRCVRQELWGEYLQSKSYFKSTKKPLVLKKKNHMMDFKHQCHFMKNQIFVLNCTPFILGFDCVCQFWMQEAIQSLPYKVALNDFKHLSLLERSSFYRIKFCLTSTFHHPSRICPLGLHTMACFK